MRIFLALEIPQDIKEKLAAVQEKLRSEIPGVRWEDPQKLHITLVFLGWVEEERTKELEGTVRKGIKGIKGVNVGLAGVGFFPKKQPRVVLVEVGEGREEIERLQKQLAGALTGAGFEFAKLSPPHVTLGRFRRGADATRRVSRGSTLRVGKLRVGKLRVGEIAIVESKLHPKGAIHTPLVRVNLAL
jgi:2'-5' RNA ligase